MKRIILAALVLSSAMGTRAETRRENIVDLVLYNANVITVDEAMPRAEAVAVAGDRIAYVGNSSRAREMAGPHAVQIDLEGMTLIPGFNDNHVHSFGAGTFFLEPILWGKSCEEIAEIIKEEAKRKKPGETIFGSSWDYPDCPRPHKSILDEAAPQNPVFLTQYSGHAAWANSAMLEKMKIGRDTPDPEGGQIVRDENGGPTGILRDTAMGNAGYMRIAKRLLNKEKHRQAMDKILDLYAEAGITSVQDNTWEPITARLLTDYKRKGKLTCRFCCWPYGQAKGAARLMALASFDDIWVRKGPWKYFSDGAFSTRTGWLTEPYADEPDNYGEPRYEVGELREIVMNAAKNHRQIAIHSIGDRAVHEVINAVEMAQAKYPWTRDLRIRLEHVQLIEDQDIDRMRELGLLACVQPFTISSPDKDLVLLGPERAKKAYRFHSLFKRGVHVSFGSDVPAEVDYQPLLNIYYATTRMNKAGTLGPLNPDERFTPLEALYCYTMGSAYAEFMENEKGSITEGKLADMAVLSRDLTSVPPEEIKDIQVLKTIVGGKVIYQR